LKKQVSPVVTVIVILVVVVIVALLWNRFANPPGGSAGGRGGMAMKIDMKKADLATARKNAAAARDKFMEQTKGTRKESGD
jgi:hypothetical protein